MEADRVGRFPLDGGAASAFAAGGSGEREPASLGALAPSWWEPEVGESAEEWLTADEAYARFSQWTADSGIVLWSHQEEALIDLAAGDHVILGTPTGSGKSLVALGMLFMGLARGRRSYYTAPIKALVSEKFFDLVRILGRDSVGMITGDIHINTDAPVICCTAEILANQALREGYRCDIGCVCMDEFHYFTDRDRGWAWQVPLLSMPRTQFMLMSATLGDTRDLAAALASWTGTEVDIVAEADRPVPLSWEYVETPLEGTVELALRRNEAPLYIVHFSQDSALRSAQALASFGVASREQRARIREVARDTRFTTAFGKILRRLITSGVGVHHAGMLPRYRLLVEKLAQQGLLPVICGTDTLGVGINVPIRTVILTALTKYDGHRVRRLRAREFQQIAGRAGRAGFDTEGMIIAEAPPHDIENARLLAKAGDDPKRLRRIKRKRPPEGFVSWNQQTFERLIETRPEIMRPRMRITHSMVLSMVEQGGDALEHVHELIERSLQTDEEKAHLAIRADEIMQTLIDTGVVVRQMSETGEVDYALMIDLPEDFALDQPLSPFLLAALELLDPDSESYTMDLISMVEATLEDPRQVLRAQERAARDRAMAELKADGVGYEERLERLADITYPQPLRDMLDVAFARYCISVPWANDYSLSPKSVLRDMLECASDFKDYIQRYRIARSEGVLLRYLAEAYRSLGRTIPHEKRTEQLDDIISWLGFVVRSIDSSLMDEWVAAGDPTALDAAPPAASDMVVADRRGLTLLVRNALFRRVRLAARGRAEALGELDGAWGMPELRWRRAIAAFFDSHDEMLIDADARSSAFLEIDESDEHATHRWHVHQIFSDSDGDRDFGIMADVDLDASQEEGEAVFENMRAGAFEDLVDPEQR
ncbi:DEAD/DEAH box helicase domain protein [Coriobacterium glomerans PW2]|uniref:DEAD/DEAH box helicase domain protein n=1 Tax=Coriobacterium glomerans (strain ATCC 49209 / DSM 20642 / JCM 10262 / PW2) TaxID=700015 RepID=F2NBH0_CORGP|nr:DUF3516 domain-containing protein [Coriobacterium glomerans]AEB06706.1 DEAD/DEAH box helicase domain protein [Coriobacterium glomerans PW2]